MSLSKPEFTDCMRVRWKGKPSQRQKWALPSSLIYYIAMNPTKVEVYQKMVKCSKFFFETNPILVASNVTNNFLCDCEARRSGHICNRSVRCNYRTKRIKIWPIYHLCCKNVSSRISFLTLKASKVNDDFAQKIFSTKEIKVVEIVDPDGMHFDYFKFLTSGAYVINLLGTKVVEDSGNAVQLEALMESLTNVESLSILCHPGMVTQWTAQMLIQLDLKNLKYLNLQQISSDMVVQDVFVFLKKHRKTRICMQFVNGMAEQRKQELDGLVDDILKTDMDHVLIHYDGQNAQKRKLLNRRFILCKNIGVLSC